MGWNDLGKLVVISCIAGILSVFGLLGQEKTVTGAKEGNLPPAYTLKPVFRTQIYYNYNLYDTAYVVRVYPDSSIKKFKRIITYYMTFVQPDAPKNGFSFVEVAIDSIYYKFEDGQNIYEFSNIETASPGVFKFEDFQTYSVPMGVEFTIVYSPYGEVAKIEGDRLLEKRKFVDTLKPAVSDTIWLYNWTDGLSDSRLKHIGDVVKIIYPSTPVFRDSIWFSPIDLYLDGLIVYDTVVVKCAGFSNNRYSIEGIFSKPISKWKKTKFYGVKSISLPYTIETGKGNFQQILSSTGIVQSLSISLDIALSVGGEKNNFKEYLTKKMHWEMVKSYKFK
jgi:hypothetical protein